MQKSALSNKLTSILGTFTVQELKRFKKWLLSPFHNEQPILPVLFGLLSTDLKKYGQVRAGKELLWKKLGYKEVYNDIKFRRLCSDLVIQAEAFIAYQTYKADIYNQPIYLLEGLSQKKLKPLYNSVLSYTQAGQNQMPHQNAEYFYAQYKLALMRHDLKQGIGREGNWELLTTALERLDEYYIAEKLKYYCNWLNYQKVLQSAQEREFRFLPQLIGYLNELPDTQLPPLIAVYLSIIATLTQSDSQEHYQHLKSLLQQHASLFPHNEAWTMYGYAQNYCIRQINTGNNSYLTELFELYQNALEKELIFTDGQLSPWHYKNIVVVGLRLKSYQWVEGFIEQYKNLLPEKFAGNAYTYNKAKLHFHKGEYGKVIELLREVAYQDVFYELDSKAMLLKTYYETNEIDALLSLLFSFRIFLRRKKGISEHHRTNYLNLVRFTEKLLALTSNPGNDAVERIKNQIRKTGNVADANWLKEKLAEKE
ncbi:MAG: hypothetical protein IPM47_07700 [Sphingobacteriales bacterium]|nr:MAG: hypothetical protein IPM47_07700 [Sphingobacteriales bacterium]